MTNELSGVLRCRCCGQRYLFGVPVMAVAGDMALVHCPVCLGDQCMVDADRHLLVLDAATTP